MAARRRGAGARTAVVESIRGGLGCLALAAALPALGCGGAGEAPPSRGVRLSVDSVLLITLDTLRADVLGHSGGDEVAATPAIDRLARQGWIFDNAHAHNVVTLPSHTNILSGRYPYEHGVRENSGFQVPPTLPTAATELSAAGFATAAFVGAFPLDHRYGLDRGFDVYDDNYPRGSEYSELTVAERRGEEVVGPALAWWQRTEGRRFLWVHLFDAHAPYEPLEPFLSRYPEDPYLGEVAAIDAYLAPLLEAVAAESTLVVLTGDHGEALGDHGELTHGFFAYEPTLRVPLMLWAPGLEPTRRADSVRHIDLLPTILEAAGVDLPEGLPGRSLLAGPASGEVLSYFEALSPNLNRGWAPLRGMLAGDSKFIEVPLPELYDLARDPGELTNRVKIDQARAFDLRQLLPQEASWPPARAAVDSEEERMLRALGYISASAEQKASYGPEDDPKNLVQLDAKLHQVIDLFHRDRLAEATALAEEVIAERPMQIGYTLLSQVLLEQELTERAIGVMESALSANLATPTLIRQLGLSLADAGRFDEAVRLLRPLSESGDPEVLSSLAQVLTDGGQQSEARRILEALAARTPDNPVTHERLALVALREGKWDETKRHAERALELNPNLSLAWNYLGGAYYNQGRPREAIDSWQRAVESNPRNFDALFNIALVAGELRDARTARDALERFVASAPPAKYAADIARARTWLARLDG